MGRYITGGRDVSDWPSGWREAVLRDLQVPGDDFIMRVLAAWQQSTPLAPYTNNPLGMPYTPGKSAELLKSGYALFVDMPTFRQAFTSFVNSPSGRALHQALLVDQKLGPTFRAIHALKWPADATETDYPSGVLDLMTSPSRERLMTSSVQDRKTSGIIGASAASEVTNNSLGSALGRAVSSALGASGALRKYNRNG